MEAPHGDNSALEVGIARGIRLVEHTLVAVACGTRLTRVDARDYEHLVLDLFLQLAQAGDVVKDGLLTVRRAGTDNEEKFVGFSAKNALYLLVALSLYSNELGRERVLGFDFARVRKLPDYIH